MHDALTTRDSWTSDDSDLDFGPASVQSRQAPTAISASSLDQGQKILNEGKIALDSAVLRQLRQSRLFSQQDLADDCWRRNIRISIATIKRAENGRAVRFRIARELARCFDVPVARLIAEDTGHPHLCH